MGCQQIGSHLHTRRLLSVAARRTGAVAPTSPSGSSLLGRHPEAGPALPVLAQRLLAGP